MLPHEARDALAADLLLSLEDYRTFTGSLPS